MGKVLTFARSALLKMECGLLILDAEELVLSPELSVSGP